MFQITTKGIPPLKEPHKWSKELGNFYDRCLDKDPEKRSSAEELLEVSAAEPQKVNDCGRAADRMLLRQSRSLW